MNVFRPLRRRRAAREAAAVEFYGRRRLVREDVTVFGEQLSELHVDTLTDVLDDDARDYYRYAIGSYERAKAGLDRAQDSAALQPVVDALVEGRHQRACVLALVAGEPPPQKLEECFFNPQHGPSTRRLRWTPPNGTEREVAVCAADARRLLQGEPPKVRLVRFGDRYVPWHVASDGSAEYFPPRIDAAAIRAGVDDGAGRAVMYGVYPTAADYGGMAL